VKTADYNCGRYFTGCFFSPQVLCHLVKGDEVITAFIVFGGIIFSLQTQQNSCAVNAWKNNSLRPTHKEIEVYFLL